MSQKGPIRVTVRCSWSGARLTVPPTSTPPVTASSTIESIVQTVNTPSSGRDSSGDVGVLPAAVFESTSDVVYMRRCIPRKHWSTTTLGDLGADVSEGGGVVLALNLGGVATTASNAATIPQQPPTLPPASTHEEGALHGDVLVKIMSHLCWTDVIRSRGVSSQWRDAATDAPVEELNVSSHLAANLREIASCLPKLQSLRLDQTSQVDDDSFSNGIAHFLHLKELSCLHTELRHSFSEILKLRHLERLNLHGNEQIEWDLSDLAALSKLQDLRCINNRLVTGDLKDLLILSKTLIVVDVSGCVKVTGNLCDLAKMPLLEWLGVSRTSVEGDLRQIRRGDFLSLQGTGLDNRIYGASEFMEVSHAADVMRARHQLMKQSRQECPIYPFIVRLSRDSPDYHERLEQRLYSSERDPPFSIETVTVGDRRGWRWSNYLGGRCDVHWLEPEPTPCDAGYTAYQAELLQLQQEEVSFFSGFFDPPTEDEYLELCRKGC